MYGKRHVILFENKFSANLKDRKKMQIPTSKVFEVFFIYYVEI